MDAPHGTRTAVFRCPTCKVAVEQEVPISGIPHTHWYRKGDAAIATQYPDAVETPAVACPEGHGEMVHLEGISLAALQGAVPDASRSFYSCGHGHGNAPCMKCHYVPGHITETVQADGSVTREFVEAVIPPDMPDNWHETYEPPTPGLSDGFSIRTVK